jgi:hypothetical protein
MIEAQSKNASSAKLSVSQTSAVTSATVGDVDLSLLSKSELKLGTKLDLPVVAGSAATQAEVVGQKAFPVAKQNNARPGKGLQPLFGFKGLWDDDDVEIVDFKSGGTTEVQPLPMLMGPGVRKSDPEDMTPAWKFDLAENPLLAEYRKMQQDWLSKNGLTPSQMSEMAETEVRSGQLSPRYQTVFGPRAIAAGANGVSSDSDSPPTAIESGLARVGAAKILDTAAHIRVQRRVGALAQKSAKEQRSIGRKKSIKREKDSNIKKANRAVESANAEQAAKVAAEQKVKEAAEAKAAMLASVVPSGSWPQCIYPVDSAKRIAKMRIAGPKGVQPNKAASLTPDMINNLIADMSVAHRSDAGFDHPTSFNGWDYNGYRIRNLVGTAATLQPAFVHPFKVVCGKTSEPMQLSVRLEWGRRAKGKVVGAPQTWTTTMRFTHEGISTLCFLATITWLHRLAKAVRTDGLVDTSPVAILTAIDEPEPLTAKTLLGNEEQLLNKLGSILNLYGSLNGGMAPDTANPANGQNTQPTGSAAVLAQGGGELKQSPNADNQPVINARNQPARKVFDDTRLAGISASMAEHAKFLTTAFGKAKNMVGTLRNLIGRTVSGGPVLPATSDGGSILDKLGSMIPDTAMSFGKAIIGSAGGILSSIGGALGLCGEMLSDPECAHACLKYAAGLSDLHTRDTKYGTVRDPVTLYSLLSTRAPKTTMRSVAGTTQLFSDMYFQYNFPTTIPVIEEDPETKDAVAARQVTANAYFHAEDGWDILPRYEAVMRAPGQNARYGMGGDVFRFSALTQNPSADTGALMAEVTRPIDIFDLANAPRCAKFLGLANGYVRSGGVRLLSSILCNMMARTYVPGGMDYSNFVADVQNEVQTVDFANFTVSNTVCPFSFLNGPFIHEAAVMDLSTYIQILIGMVPDPGGILDTPVMVVGVTAARAGLAEVNSMLALCSCEFPYRQVTFDAHPVNNEGGAIAGSGFAGLNDAIMPGIQALRLRHAGFAEDDDNNQVSRYLFVVSDVSPASVSPATVPVSFKNTTVAPWVAGTVWAWTDISTSVEDMATTAPTGFIAVSTMAIESWNMAYGDKQDINDAMALVALHAVYLPTPIPTNGGAPGAGSGAPRMSQNIAPTWNMGVQSPGNPNNWVGATPYTWFITDTGVVGTGVSSNQYTIQTSISSACYMNVMFQSPIAVINSKPATLGYVEESRLLMPILNAKLLRPLNRMAITSVYAQLVMTILDQGRAMARISHSFVRRYRLSAMNVILSPVLEEINSVANGHVGSADATLYQADYELFSEGMNHLYQAACFTENEINFQQNLVTPIALGFGTLDGAATTNNNDNTPMCYFPMCVLPCFMVDDTNRFALDDYIRTNNVVADQAYTALNDYGGANAQMWLLDRNCTTFNRQFNYMTDQHRSGNAAWVMNKLYFIRIDGGAAWEVGRWILPPDCQFSLARNYAAGGYSIVPVTLQLMADFYTIKSIFGAGRITTEVRSLLYKASAPQVVNDSAILAIKFVPTDVSKGKEIGFSNAVTTFDASIY